MKGYNITIISLLILAAIVASSTSNLFRSDTYVKHTTADLSAFQSQVDAYRSTILASNTITPFIFSGANADSASTLSKTFVTTTYELIPSADAYTEMIGSNMFFSLTNYSFKNTLTGTNRVDADTVRLSHSSDLQYAFISTTNAIHLEDYINEFIPVSADIDLNIPKGQRLCVIDTNASTFTVFSNETTTFTAPSVTYNPTANNYTVTLDLENINKFTVTPETGTTLLYITYNNVSLDIHDTVHVADMLKDENKLRNSTVITLTCDKLPRLNLQFKYLSEMDILLERPNNSIGTLSTKIYF